MSSSQPLRLSGASVVVGVLLAGIGIAASSVLFPAGIDASVLLLLGLPGLYGSQATRTGTLGLAGMVSMFIGIAMFGIFFSLFAAILLPSIAAQLLPLVESDQVPGIGPFFILGTLLTAFGPILFGIPIVRGRMQPRWPGYLLILSGALSVLAFVVQGPGMSASPVSIVINLASPLLLFVALGWLGWQLWIGESLHSVDMVEAPRT